MPRYNVTSPRTHDGIFYAPNSAHSVITVDKPFKKLPAGLELIKGEEELTPAQKAAITKKANADKKAADEQKAKDIQDELDNLNTENADNPDFTGEKKSNVETL